MDKNILKNVLLYFHLLNTRIFQFKFFRYVNIRILEKKRDYLNFGK